MPRENKKGSSKAEVEKAGIENTEPVKEEPTISDVLQMLKKIDCNLDKVMKGQSNLEKRFSSLEDKINAHEVLLNELKESISFNDAELEDLKLTTNNLKVSFNEKIDASNNLISVIKDLQAQVDNQERYSRNFNLRFIGIPENQPAENCIERVKSLIEKHAGITADIENAHRTVRKIDGKPRHVIAKFLRRPDRFAVLKVRNYFRSDGIIVAEDLIQKDLIKRRQLSKIMSEARNNSQKVRFSRGDLYIDGKRYVEQANIEHQVNPEHEPA